MNRRTSSCPLRSSSAGVPRASTRPSCRNSIVSARRRALGMLWVTTISVAPRSCFTRTSRSSISSDVTGSSPALGSSTSRIAGSRAIARASPARLRMPPDSAPGIDSAARASPTAASFSRARARTSASGSVVCRRSGKATFSATVIESNSAAFWNRKPIRRRTAAKAAGGSAVISASSTKTRPASGRRRPTTCRSITLLPVPLRPSTTVARARGIASDTSSSTRNEPNAFDTRSSRTAAAGSRPPPSPETFTPPSPSRGVPSLVGATAPEAFTPPSPGRGRRSGAPAPRWPRSSGSTR